MGFVSGLGSVFNKGTSSVSFKIKYEQYKKEIEDKRVEIKKKIQEQKNKRSKWWDFLVGFVVLLAEQLVQ